MRGAATDSSSTSGLTAGGSTSSRAFRYSYSIAVRLSWRSSPGGVSIVGVGGMLNVLKVVKAIRIARVLRLLRVLKIFRRIKNADSRMAQRHIAAVSAAAVTTFVFSLLFLAIAGTIVPLNSMESEYQAGLMSALRHIDEAYDGQGDDLASFAATNPGILVVEKEGDVLYSRFDQEHYDRFFRANDYAILETATTTLFVDIIPINRDQAAANLRYFVIIVAMVLVFLFAYGPHFALTVTRSDPRNCVAEWPIRTTRWR